MSRRQATLGAVLSVILAACSAGTALTDPGLATPRASHATPSPLSATPVPATGSPSLAAIPTPTPTRLPVPPKPTGVALDIRYEGSCPSHDPGDPDVEMCSIDDAFVTVSWKKPRTKGVTIRVYGVTECFGADGGGRMIDGYCLREHTALPSSVRVLLAKAPASQGSVTVRMLPGVSLAATVDGHEVYSVVLGAYNADGDHSIFAIADTSEYCTVADVACNGADW